MNLIQRDQDACASACSHGIKSLMSSPLPFDIDEPLFPLVVTATAMGKPHQTIRMRVQRDPDLLRMAEGRAADGPLANEDVSRGKTRLVTFRGVLTLAAADPLIDLGISVADAHEAAIMWTCMPDSFDVGLLGGRSMAGLYDEPALTLLYYHPRMTGVSAALPASDGWNVLGVDVFGASVFVNLNGVHGRALEVCSRFLETGKV